MILDELAAYAAYRVEEAKKKLSPEEIRTQAEHLPKGDFRFKKALKKKGMSFICEVKKASPSKGVIAEEFPYTEIARAYEAAGADCVSVLTEPKWFLGSDDIFRTDIENCINDNPYLEGYIFEVSGEIQGYGMIAKSFSTEFGRPCMWIEDIYIKESCRGAGIGSKFIDYIGEKYPDAILRLEVEEENERAVNVYKKNGFSFLPYLEMKK